MNNASTRSITSQSRGSGGHRQKYEERDVRRWLHNLASGMQVAGHSMLLMEQLQPGMLPRRREKIVYIFLTRCLAGLAVGLAGGALQRGLYVGSSAMEPGSAAAWGFAAGLATAVAATTQIGKRILKRFPISSPLGLQIFRVVLGTTVAGVGVAVGEFAYRSVGELFGHVSRVGMTLDQLVLMCLIAVLTGLLGARTMGRAFTSDIESIETLGMSWSAALPGIIAGGLVSFILSLVYVYLISTSEVPTLDSLFGGVAEIATDADSKSAAATDDGGAGWQDKRTPIDRVFQCSVITIVGLVIGGTFHGLIPQTRKHKSTPNQGILLTAYYCLRYGVILGGLAGGLWGLCIYTMHDRLPKASVSEMRQASESNDISEAQAATVVATAEQSKTASDWLSLRAKAGLIVGLFGGFGVFIVAGIWFGGLDVMRHYVLRFMLAVYGYLPLRLKTFLAYVERDLTFLDRVGGGYRFIHRYLLEYFASSPLDGAVQAATSETHMLRRTRMPS